MTDYHVTNTESVIRISKSQTKKPCPKCGKLLVSGYISKHLKFQHNESETQNDILSNKELQMTIADRLSKIKENSEPYYVCKFGDEDKKFNRICEDIATNRWNEWNEIYMTKLKIPFGSPGWSPPDEIKLWIDINDGRIGESFNKLRKCQW